MSNGWSDNLLEQTRNALNDGLVASDEFLHMKNIKGIYGKIHIEDLLIGKLLIQDKLTEAEYGYNSVNEIIADG